jgi:plasmid replication initiation protein
MHHHLIKDGNSITVKQHNALTEARYDMSPLQKNMFYLLLAQLKDESSLNEPIKYKLSIKDINASRNIRVNKLELRQAARGLISSGLRLYDSRQKKLIAVGILASADYGEGFDRENLIVIFDPKIRPFLYDVKSRFTVFSLQNALNLKSKYSKRIYEMLCQFKNTGIFRISVQELKERFELIDSKTGRETYPDFGDFTRRILAPAKKEINETTEISFDYATKKTGRKITDLEFWITSKGIAKELAEPAPEDLEAEKLKERLVMRFQLSKTLAKKAIENIPIREIHKILHDIQLEESDKKIRKMGAYATTVLQNRLDSISQIDQTPNSSKHIALKSVQQRTQDPDLERENLTRLYGFRLEKKDVYTLNIGYSSEQLKSAISKVEEALKKQEISDNPKQILQVLRERLKTRKEHSNFSSAARSNSVNSIGVLLASSILTPMAEPLSEEEKKLSQEKNEVWKELIMNFNLSDEEADSLVEEPSLEALKAAISKVSQAVEAEEIPQETSHIIQRLKKELDLA